VPDVQVYAVLSFRLFFLVPLLKTMPSSQCNKRHFGARLKSALFEMLM